VAVASGFLIQSSGIQGAENDDLLKGEALRACNEILKQVRDEQAALISKNRR
jgi:hypothetical protein